MNLSIDTLMQPTNQVSQRDISLIAVNSLVLVVLLVVVVFGQTP